MAVVAQRVVHDPIDLRREQLEERLAKIQPGDLNYITKPDVNFAELQKVIASKPKLWKELIPPPPVPIRPPPPPKIPNLANLLKGVRPTMTTVGRGETAKVLIKLPKSSRGELKAVGDEINGVKIISFGRYEVVFELRKDGRRYTHSLARSR